jgi:hypothetical protein
MNARVKRIKVFKFGFKHLKNMINYAQKIDYLEEKLKKATKVIQILQSGKNEVPPLKVDIYEENAIENLFSMAIGNLNFSNQTETDSSIQKNTYMFIKMIVECLPYPVFIKDHDRRYLMVNKHELNLFGMQESDVIGKMDDDFVTDKEELEQIHQSDNIVLTDKESIELPTQKFTLGSGTTYVFKTHKLPIINPYTERLNVLGFSVDVTDTVNLAKLNKVIMDFRNPYL